MKGLLFLGTVQNIVLQTQRENKRERYLYPDLSDYSVSRALPQRGVAPLRPRTGVK